MVQVETQCSSTPAQNAFLLVLPDRFSGSLFFFIIYWPAFSPSRSQTQCFLPYFPFSPSITIFPSHPPSLLSALHSLSAFSLPDSGMEMDVVGMYN